MSTVSRRAVTGAGDPGVETVTGGADCTRKLSDSGIFWFFSAVVYQATTQSQA